MTAARQLPARDETDTYAVRGHRCAARPFVLGVSSIAAASCCAGVASPGAFPSSFATKGSGARQVAEPSGVER
jgi:hypothetical protein